MHAFAGGAVERDSDWLRGVDVLRVAALRVVADEHAPASRGRLAAVGVRMRGAGEDLAHQTTRALADGAPHDDVHPGVEDLVHCGCAHGDQVRARVRIFAAHHAQDDLNLKAHGVMACDFYYFFIHQVL